MSLLRIFCALFLFLPLISLANTNPRIGVVLGGGGARGFAHLGVLQELEKLRIPIACISGTSAGALIGGMYANGMSLAQMDEIFKNTNWDAMLSGKPDRRAVPFDRKSDDYKNYLDISLGLRNNSIQVPRSALNSQDIDLYIRQLTRDRVVTSFDSLPIPFRALATDLSNGQAVVFDKGSLATALRASMAVPGLFVPVEDEQRLLVDGGLARNLPIEDIKGKCADIVIVVDVGAKLLEADQIQTWLDVLTQTSILMVERNAQEQKQWLSDDDVVITPDLQGFSAASFAQNQAIIQHGVTAVESMRSRLERFSVSAEVYQQWQAKLILPSEPTMNEIRIVEPITPQYINPDALKNSLNIRSATYSSISDIRQTLQTLFASGDYDSLTYRINEQNGQNVLDIMPIERAIGPNYLRFGLTLEGTTTGDANFNFLVSYLRTWVNKTGAYWRTDFQLGQNKSLSSQFHQPLALNSPFFIEPSVAYSEENWPFFTLDHHKYAEINWIGLGTDLDFGVTLGRYGELRTGPFWRYYDPHVTMGALPPSQALFAQKSHESGWKVAGVLDQFDNPRWPRTGYFVSADLRHDFTSISAINNRYYALIAEKASTFKDITFRFTGKLKGNIRSEDTTQSLRPQFLGGFLNLSGYQQNELYGDRVALARLMLYWRIATLPSALGSGVYAGSSFEWGKVWDRSFSSLDTHWLFGGSLFLGADTLLGPFFIGMGNAEGGQLTGYMFLGVNY